MTRISLKNLFDNGYEGLTYGGRIEEDIRNNIEEDIRFYFSGEFCHKKKGMVDTKRI